jgi:hypothetical protein
MSDIPVHISILKQINITMVVKLTLQKKKNMKVAFNEVKILLPGFLLVAVCQKFARKNIVICLPSIYRKVTWL